MVSMNIILIFIWQFLLVEVFCDTVRDPLIVRTHTGLVKGVKKITLLDNVKYLAFLGIPYAQPPVGKLRFKVCYLSTIINNQKFCKNLINFYINISHDDFHYFTTNKGTSSD